MWVRTNLIACPEKLAEKLACPEKSRELLVPTLATAAWTNLIACPGKLAEKLACPEKLVCPEKRRVLLVLR